MTGDHSLISMSWCQWTMCGTGISTDVKFVISFSNTNISNAVTNPWITIGTCAMYVVEPAAAGVYCSRTLNRLWIIGSIDRGHRYTWIGESFEFCFICKKITFSHQQDVWIISGFYFSEKLNYFLHLKFGFPYESKSHFRDLISHSQNTFRIFYSTRLT